MFIKINEHKLEIIKTPVNEKEINITKCYFEFPEIMEDYNKEAYFTLKGKSYKVIIQNNECDIPSETLEEKGTVELGVVAFKVEDEKITRYNPSPTYFETWLGSLKDAENSEEVTPTDKEQIEQLINDTIKQVDNLNIDAEKEEKKTTIIITKKDGSTKEVEILDGEKGDKGDTGAPGQIRYHIVQTLPSEDIDKTALYFVEKKDPSYRDMYDEYAWLDAINDWEYIGEKQIKVDLTDYVKFDDYATYNKSGVIKSSVGLNVDTNGFVSANTYNYDEYLTKTNGYFIGKGTLENILNKRFEDLKEGDISNLTELIEENQDKIIDRFEVAKPDNGLIKVNAITKNDEKKEVVTIYNGLDGKYPYSAAGGQAIKDLNDKFKDCVTFNDYATPSKGGIIRVNENAYGLATNTNNGFIFAREDTYENYLTKSNLYVIGKGTLENVLNARIGDIDKILDEINGEVI